jgi:hypothetical protein
MAEEEPAADLKKLGLIREKLEARKKGLLPSTAAADSFAEYDAGGEYVMLSLCVCHTMKVGPVRSDGCFYDGEARDSCKP